MKCRRTDIRPNFSYLLNRTFYKKLTFAFGGMAPEAYLESFQASKIKRFTKVINDFEPFSNFAKSSILEVSQCSEYAPGLDPHNFQSEVYFREDWLISFSLVMAL